MKRIFHYFIFVLFLNGCKDNNSEVMIEKFPTGEVYSEIPYKIIGNDTLMEGHIKFYYKNGNVETDFFCKNDQKTGLYTNYDSNGSMLFQANYKKNKMHGYSYTYFSNGKIKFEQLYKQDSLVMVKNYQMNGILTLMTIYQSLNEAKYIIQFDSLGRKIYEKGNYNRLDTFLR